MKSVTKANSAMRNLTVAAATLSCMVICMFSYGARAAEFNLTPNQENAAPLTKLSADEGTEFVKEYYAALSRVDIPAVVAKFAETVDYEGEGQRDRSYIRSDLEKYVARWPILSFKPEATTVSPKEDGSAAVTFNLSYSLANDTKTTSGHSTNNWILRRINEKLQIISQREVVHPNARPGLDKSPIPEAVEPEEALSDEDLAKSRKTQAAPERVSKATSAAKTPRTNAPGDFVIALDIGHSPLRGGAISARGVSEYQFNRRLVTELYANLQSFGFTRSFIINPEGEEIHLIKRAAVANERNADLFLAIHHDSVKDTYLKKWETDGKIQKYCDDFHGYSIFISRKNPKAAESARFATALGSALLNTGLTPTLHHAEQENRPLLDREKGIYAFDDLVVLKTTKMPAVLLECGVIVNRIEEEKLNTPEYRDRLTNAIEQAISKFASTPAATANSSQAPAKQQEN